MLAALATIGDGVVAAQSELGEATGLGLKATRRFAKGELITEYTGQRIRQARRGRRSGPWFACDADKYAAAALKVQTHIAGCRVDGVSVFIDGDKVPRLWSGGGSFANHHDKPNAVLDCVCERLVLKALRQIDTGGEIYLSYGAETSKDVAMGRKRWVQATNSDGRLNVEVQLAEQCVEPSPSPIPSHPPTRSIGKRPRLEHPVQGDLVRLGDDRVHEVEYVEVQDVGLRGETPQFYLSGRLGPTTLNPTVGGSRWEPVARIIPASLLDDVGLCVRVINLKRRADRLAAASQLLSAHQLEWKAHLAVDSTGLTWEAIVRDGVASEQAVKDARLEYPTVCRRIGTFSPHLTLGAVACAMSHRALWQELVDSAGRPSQCMLVLEDDVDAISLDLRAALTDLLRQSVLPTHWQVCYLGSHEHSRVVKRSGERPRVHQVERGTTMTGGFAYLLNRKGAEHLLSSRLFPLTSQWDVGAGEIEWGEMTRFSVSLDAPLLTSPRSEEGRGDTDVQHLGNPATLAHSLLLPQHMMERVFAGKRRGSTRAKSPSPAPSVETTRSQSDGVVAARATLEHRVPIPGRFFRWHDRRGVVIGPGEGLPEKGRERRMVEWREADGSSHRSWTEDVLFTGPASDGRVLQGWEYECDGESEPAPASTVAHVAEADVATNMHNISAFEWANFEMIE